MLKKIGCAIITVALQEWTFVLTSALVLQIHYGSPGVGGKVQRGSKGPWLEAGQ